MQCGKVRGELLCCEERGHAGAHQDGNASWYDGDPLSERAKEHTIGASGACLWCRGACVWDLEEEKLPVVGKNYRTSLSRHPVYVEDATEDEIVVIYHDGVGRVLSRMSLDQWLRLMPERSRQT